VRVLLVIDPQNDFISGSLAVPGAKDIIPVVNRLMKEGGYDAFVLSQDFHPADHGSFASQHPGKKPHEMGELGGKPQRLWPDHCVQGTWGAEFHAGLDLSRVTYIQQKGLDKTVDSYSAFRDNNEKSLTGLADYLKKIGATGVDFCGVATDFCDKATGLDGVKLMPGVKFNFIEDASRGISPQGVKDALREMRAAGINIITSAQRLPKPPGFHRKGEFNP
jgi:nicotinamidase/pyrazinamidase